MYKLTFQFLSEQSKGLNQLKWEKFSTRHIWKSIITLYAGYVEYAAVFPIVNLAKIVLSCSMCIRTFCR